LAPFQKQVEMHNPGLLISQFVCLLAVELRCTGNDGGGLPKQFVIPS